MEPKTLAAHFLVRSELDLGDEPHNVEGIRAVFYDIQGGAVLMMVSRLQAVQFI